MAILSELELVDIPALPAMKLPPKVATYSPVVIPNHGVNGDHALPRASPEPDHELTGGHVITRMKSFPPKHAKLDQVLTRSGPTGELVPKPAVGEITSATANIHVVILTNSAALLYFRNLNHVVFPEGGLYGLTTPNALLHAPVVKWSKPDSTSVPILSTRMQPYVVWTVTGLNGPPGHIARPPVSVVTSIAAVATNAPPIWMSKNEIVAKLANGSTGRFGLHVLSPVLVVPAPEPGSTNVVPKLFWPIRPFYLLVKLKLKYVVFQGIGPFGLTGPDVPFRAEVELPLELAVTTAAQI